MACESDKCEKYGMHHDYEDGVEVKRCQFCQRDYITRYWDHHRRLLKCPCEKCSKEAERVAVKIREEEEKYG